MANKSQSYSMKIFDNRTTLIMAALFLVVMRTPAATFTNLYNFSALSATDTNQDGSGPLADLVASGSVLYGTAADGGTNNDGVVFALGLVPTFNIQLVNKAVVLSWSDPSLSLYAAPTLTSVFTNIPSATSPYTNAITGEQQYFQVH